MYALQDTLLLNQKVWDCAKQQLLTEAVELLDPKWGHYQQINHRGWYLPVLYHSSLQDIYMQLQYLHMCSAHLAVKR